MLLALASPAMAVYNVEVRELDAGVSTLYDECEFPLYSLMPGVPDGSYAVADCGGGAVVFPIPSTPIAGGDADFDEVVLLGPNGVVDRNDCEQVDFLLEGPGRAGYLVIECGAGGPAPSFVSSYE